MANAAAGWFDDGSGQLRWWDGVRWTTYYYDARTGAVVDRSATPVGPVAVATASNGAMSGLNLKAAIITTSVIVVVVLAAWGPAALLLLAGLVAGAVGLYAVLKGSLGRLRIRTRPVAIAVLAAGVFASSIGGAALAASQTPSRDVVAFVDTSSSTPRETTSTPTATPTPTPVRKETIVEEPSPIGFTSSTVDDPNLDVGLTAVATPGVNGEKVTRIRVITVDGAEVSREVVEEVVTIQPVNEVVTVGSRQPPPPPPPANDGCDPNYEGACVPISSDVDCAGGSGNGPAYVDGPVWVVGSDIYDLDRDGDGIACDT
jgi:hypothetical protein